MQRYLGLSGDAGVIAYEIGADYVRVRFRNGKPYRYSYASAGREHVEEMKKRASKGRGLSTYISQHVHDLYDRTDESDVSNG